MGNKKLVDEKCKVSRGELAPGQPHPAAFDAKEWIADLPYETLLRWREAFASCALELAEVCVETLNRLLTAQPVSDRYVLGLAWTMRHDPTPAKSKPRKRRSA